MTLFDAWGRPTRCTECRGKLPEHAHAGRPRVTCSKACARARAIRLKREERFWGPGKTPRSYFGYDREAALVFVVGPYKETQIAALADAAKHLGIDP